MKHVTIYRVFNPQASCILILHCPITLTGEDSPGLDDTGGNDFEVSNLGVVTGHKQARYYHPLSQDVIDLIGIKQK